jgi:parallel beta-helix repeat protein
MNAFSVFFIEPTGNNYNVTLGSITTANKEFTLVNKSNTYRVLINGRDTLSPKRIIRYYWTNSEHRSIAPDLTKYYSIYGDTLKGDMFVDANTSIRNKDDNGNYLTIAQSGYEVRANSEMYISSAQSVYLSGSSINSLVGNDTITYGHFVGDNNVFGQLGAGQYWISDDVKGSLVLTDSTKALIQAFTGDFSTGKKILVERDSICLLGNSDTELLNVNDTLTKISTIHGAVYTNDYSANYTDRSLVDKGYTNSGTATLTNKIWNGSVIGSSYGGAGTVNGILKANGSGAVSAAVSGTDYQYPIKRYSVIEYGAVGDGVTDNTTAFAAARDAAGSGGVIIVPSGIYIQNTLTLNVSNQTWVIDPGATIKINAGSTTSVVVVSGVSKITITGGGAIDGNESNISSSGVAGIYTTNSSVTDLLIENITIQNTEGYGVQAFGSRTKIKNCKFTNCGTTSVGASALVVTPSGSHLYDVTIEGNTIDNSMMPSATYNDSILILMGSPRSGLSYTYKVFNSKIINNIVKGPSDPQGAGGGAVCITVGAEGADVIGNITNGGSMGISVDGCNNVKVIGNTFNGANWFGIELANANLCEVIGNTVNGQGLTGKTLSGGFGALIATNATTSNYCTISNNILDSVYATSANVVSLNSGKEHTVTNNLVKCYGSSSGIVTTVPGCVITGNTVKGSSQSDGQTAIKFINVFKPGVISNNVIRDCNRAISMYATSGTVDSITISGNSIISTNTPLYTNLSGGAVFGNQIKIIGNTGITDYSDYNASTPYGNALTSNPLSQFAATTSAQLAGVVSDETGSGALVFATSPTFTTQITTPVAYGSSSSGGSLTLGSTSHATKGKILFGSGSAYDESLGFLGIGTQSPTAQLHISGNISASAWTTNGIGFRTSDQTFNDNTSSGTVTNMYFHRLGVPTVTSTSVTTYTNGVGFYFPAVAASGNATITNGYSIGTQGNIQVGGSTIQMSNGGANSTLQIPNSTTAFRIQTGGSNATRFTIATSTGLIGIGPTAPTPTAYLTLAAGTATASTAPLKLTSGTNLTTPEAGAIEFDGTNYFATSSTTRYTIAKTLTNTASLDFDLTSANSQDLTITVTGASDGDAVSVGVPNASATANVVYTWWTSATNTVTVRASRIDVASGANPASGTFRASVIKY